MSSTVDDAATLDTGPGPGPPRRLNGDAWRRIQLQEMALPVVVVLLLIVGGIADRDAFLTQDNLLTVLRQASVTGVVAIGMTHSMHTVQLSSLNDYRPAGWVSRTTWTS